MIRINLHPVRAQKKAQEGRRQLLFFVLIVVAEMVVLGLLYSWQAGEIDLKQKEVSLLQDRIQKLKRDVGDFDELQSQRDRLISQRNIINKLQKGRTGPVAMLREMSDILTQGKGPTVNQTQYEVLLRRDPNAGFNSNWNPHRLWITGFSEKSGQLMITGFAKDYDDVAEFNKRISLSRFFFNDTLARNKKVYNAKLGLKVVAFRIRCQVKY